MALLGLAEVDGDDLPWLAFLDLLTIAINHHVNMLFEKWFRSLQLLADYKCAHIWLRPKERKSSTDLHVRIDVHTCSLMPYYNLFQLAEI